MSLTISTGPLLSSIAIVISALLLLLLGLPSAIGGLWRSRLLLLGIRIGCLLRVRVAGGLIISVALLLIWVCLSVASASAAAVASVILCTESKSAAVCRSGRFW